jgi:hypothetical protein
MISRRNFLRGTLIAGGGLAALGGLRPLVRLAGAQAVNPDAPDRYYVFCYFNGGWDILLGLDPRDPRRFNDGNLRDTRIQPGYELLQNTDGRLVETAAGLTFGPFIGDLARHADRLAVVRGMSMDTLTHEAGRRRFLTGKPPSGLQARGSSGATWLASHLGEAAPIPNLAVRVESYNRDQPDFATALHVDSVDDLLRALRPSAPFLADRVRRQVDATLAETADCAGPRESPLWRASEGGRRKARDMVAGGYDALFDFQARNATMEQIRGHYGITTDPRSPEVQAALAVQAITGGVSRCVSIEVASGLDTHFVEWTTDQGPRQMRGFNAVARLVEDLASREYGDGQSWLDHTVILGFSEFSRGALLNDRGGRDHSLTNAAFLIGANIRGGQVVGASSDVGMGPTTTDPATGRPDPAGVVVRPEHLLQTLFAEVGIGDGPDLRVDPLPVLLRT